MKNKRLSDIRKTGS